MSIIQSVVLGLVQGISEFLPISSSGHLDLTQHLMGLKPTLTFDIFLNTATFLSVLFFFRNRLSYFTANLKYIIVGSIPAGLIGIIFKDFLEKVFSNPQFLPVCFLITAILVFSIKFINQKDSCLDYKKALIIGFFQGLAILPAVSRSGATIFAGLLMGLSPVNAFNFSFSLFIPASFGAIIIDAKKLSGINFGDPAIILAFITAFVIGIIALTLLQKILVGKKLWIFGVYVFIVSVISFFLV